ncbi:HNH/ENDO VII family nuclease [Moraxella bovis]|uniref:HNH/ENDO VII family nuclease n=1 Tax=Moraxella bovis TaxID=476 RepID=UPI003B9809E2
MDDKGNYQTVIAIHTEATPLNSYNLEVDTDHTFFIKGIDGVESVWVHNKDCWVDIPNNARQKQVGNDTVYEFDDNGRTVQVIKNPDWKQGDKKAQYIEVETTNGQISVKHEDRTDINYSYDVNGNKVVKDENNQYFAKDPNKPQDSADQYKWIDEHRHPDPNVQSSFGTSKPVANSTYFTTQTEWQAPGKGTGLKYTVYQQDIDLNARPFISDGDMRTNAELMKKGNAPYVLKNGKYEQIQLHHSQQDGRGFLFELTEQTHLKTGDDKGGKALHPYGQNQHPDFPQDIRQKLLSDLDKGNFETRTVGSGALAGQEIIQKYQNDRKLPQVIKKTSK